MKALLVLLMVVPGPAPTATPRPQQQPPPTCAEIRRAVNSLTARSEHELGLNHMTQADRYARGADRLREYYASKGCKP